VGSSKSGKSKRRFMKRPHFKTYCPSMVHGWPTIAKEVGKGLDL
jgi:hypothetical protein